jgi:toxin HigB-1
MPPRNSQPCASPGPPGNRLERLKGDRQGQHTIRINDEWRICFRWEAGNAYEVEIVDYH